MASRSGQNARRFQTSLVVDDAVSRPAFHRSKDGGNIKLGYSFNIEVQHRCEKIAVIPRFNAI